MLTVSVSAGGTVAFCPLSLASASAFSSSASASCSRVLAEAISAAAAFSCCSSVSRAMSSCVYFDSHAFFFVNRLIGACQQEIRLYDRRSLEVSKLRKFRANRWHDAADVVTGLVEREIAGRDTRIKSVKFM